MCVYLYSCVFYHYYISPFSSRSLISPNDMLTNAQQNFATPNQKMTTIAESATKPLVEISASDNLRREVFGFPSANRKNNKQRCSNLQSVHSQVLWWGIGEVLVDHLQPGAHTMWIVTQAIAWGLTSSSDTPPNISHRGDRGSAVRRS